MANSVVLPVSTLLGIDVLWCCNQSDPELASKIVCMWHLAILGFSLSVGANGEEEVWSNHTNRRLVNDLWVACTPSIDLRISVVIASMLKQLPAVLQGQYWMPYRLRSRWRWHALAIAD